MRETLAFIRAGEGIGCGTTMKIVGGTAFNRLRLERLNPVLRSLGLCGGAYLVCRKGAFDALGGFSTALYAAEEIDFVFRLKRYGRKHGRRFAILGTPAVTSGRKGECRFSAMVGLVVSHTVAVLLFGLHLVLPERWMPTPTRMLSYWYGRR